MASLGKRAKLGTVKSIDECRAGMKLVSLSPSAHRPCILFRLGTTSVLLDCAIEMDSLASFLPCSIVRSNRISWQKKVHPYGKGVIPVLKQINDSVYVELVPEIRTISFGEVDFASLDAILISNIPSLIAMPMLISRRPEFHGKVFATDPVIQLGKLVMEDLCTMFERVDRPQADEWAWKMLASGFPNPPKSDPLLWLPFYTRDEMEDCLARVQRVFFREEIELNGTLKLTPYSSGHSIGSCNWLLEASSGQQRIGYFSASSLRLTHSKKLELSAFSQLNSLIVTSMSTLEHQQSPEVTVCKFTTTAVETLKIGGNVLIPVVPTGLVYDLFECLFRAIEVNNLSRNIPVYFICSVAESCLEFANILAEWLTEEKSTRVYKPEEPFYHSELVRNGRIRVFNSLHGQFSRECRQPCVVFTGHPSLRIGDVVQLLDFWGGNSHNAIMMVDPDYPLETYYAPYKSLAIRAYYFPIETRLDCTQVLKIINDLAPKHVLYPEQYTSTFGTLSALAVPTTAFRQDQPVFGNRSLDNNTAVGGGAGAAGDDANTVSMVPQKRIRIDSDILKRIKFDAKNQGLCRVHCLLAVDKHGSLKLLPNRRRREEDGRPEQNAEAHGTEAAALKVASAESG